jgi:hypothetical protein
MSRWQSLGLISVRVRPQSDMESRRGMDTARALEWRRLAFDA